MQMNQQPISVVFSHLSDFSWTGPLYDLLLSRDDIHLMAPDRSFLPLQLHDVSVPNLPDRPPEKMLFMDGNFIPYHLITQYYLDNGWTYTPRFFSYIHGGFYEPFDMTRAHPNGYDLERYQLLQPELLFVQTPYHKRLISQMFPEVQHKIIIAPFPITPTPGAKTYRMSWASRIPFGYVGRPTFDKGFDLLPHCVDGYRGPDRESYYQFLQSRRFMIFPARKETYGVSVIESILQSCIPILPYREPYISLYGDSPVYFHKYTQHHIETAMVEASELTSDQIFSKQNHLINCIKSFISPGIFDKILQSISEA